MSGPPIWIEPGVSRTPESPVLLFAGGGCVDGSADSEFCLAVLADLLRPVGLAAGPRVVAGLTIGLTSSEASTDSLSLTCSCCWSCLVCLVFAPLPVPFLAVDADEALEAEEADEAFGTGVLRPFLLLKRTAVRLFTPAGDGVCDPALPTELSLEFAREDGGDSMFDLAESPEDIVKQN